MQQPMYTATDFKRRYGNGNRVFGGGWGGAMAKTEPGHNTTRHAQRRFGEGLLRNNSVTLTDGAKGITASYDRACCCWRLGWTPLFMRLAVVGACANGPLARNTDVTLSSGATPFWCWCSQLV